MRRDPLGFLLQVARQHEGVVDLGGLGSQRFFLVHQPEHVRYVLQHNNANYHKGTNFKEGKLLVGDGLIGVEGATWQRQRRLVQPAFHRPQLAAMAHEMTEAIAVSLERWRPWVDTGQPVDLVEEMMRLTQRVVLRTIFGSDSQIDQDVVIQEWGVARDFLNHRMWALLKAPIALPTPGNLRFRLALRRLDEVVYHIIRERRGQRTEGRVDMLSMLLGAVDAETSRGMSDLQVRDEVMTMFLAGYETTALALSWLWGKLCEFPQVEQRVRQEVEQELGERTPGVEDCARMRYGRMVLDEVLRLFPPVWIYGRTPREDDVIGGFRVPAGANLLLSPYVTQRNPTLWADPERFDPERFKPEAAAGRQRFAYFPFGGGQRQCIGDNFALLEMQLVLGMVLQRYQLRLRPGTQLQPEAQLTLRPRGGLWVTLHSRAAAPPTSTAAVN
jgi:cytochrome P450